jgi:feruloyl esterase
MKAKTLGSSITGPLMVLTLSLLSGTYATAVTAATCGNLTSAAIEDTTITSATLLPAGAGLPEYCQVRGQIETEIGFEVRLPTDWNGKFYFQGVGGNAGVILPPGPGLVRGYAAATTDTGHQGAPPNPLFDGSWALNNPERQVNYGHRAVHLVTVSAKRIIEAFYGQPPEYSYFEGCSNGGRQALMEAQRYPGDFDGIIAGAPALDYTGFMMDWNWNAQALQRAPIPANKVSLIANAVLRECDARDGLRDGLISDPRRCHFNPKKLQCRTGDGADCLTRDQVRTLRRIYAGPESPDEEPIYPGFPPGHEDGGDGWPLWMTGNGIFPPLQLTAQDQYFRFFIFGPAFDPLQFDYDKDRESVAPTGEFLNATDPDLSAFKARGGKLILWHGWADPALTPERSVGYFLDVVDTLDEDTVDFFRLFLAPGVRHCGGGPGPNAFDMLTALENWVERDIAPDRIVATHFTGNTADRTRPLCPYPQEAKYKGKGSINDAANFVCRGSLRDEKEKRHGR